MLTNPHPPRPSTFIFRLIILVALLSACSPPLQGSPSPVPPTETLLPTDPAITEMHTPPSETPTPTVAVVTATPVPALVQPCPITATRTPPPAAPTYGPDPNNPAPRVVDPHVEVCASQAILAVGETTTITALAIAVGIPHYRLSIAAEGAPPVEIGVATYDGFLTPGAPLDGIELVSATGGMTQAEFTLRGTQPGIYTLTLVASGEVHYGYPGPASWLAVSSDPFLIQIEP